MLGGATIGRYLRVDRPSLGAVRWLAVRRLGRPVRDPGRHDRAGQGRRGYMLGLLGPDSLADDGTAGHGDRCPADRGSDRRCPPQSPPGCRCPVRPAGPPTGDAPPSGSRRWPRTAPPRLSVLPRPAQHHGFGERAEAVVPCLYICWARDAPIMSRRRPGQCPRPSLIAICLFTAFAAVSFTGTGKEVLRLGRPGKHPLDPCCRPRRAEQPHPYRERVRRTAAKFHRRDEQRPTKQRSDGPTCLWTPIGSR